jgi:hypothetical protein
MSWIIRYNPSHEGLHSNSATRTQVIPGLSLNKKGRLKMRQPIEIFGAPGKDRTCDLRIRNSEKDVETTAL